MNLRHIEIFHAVYVNGSVSAAARVLNVSQPSVSKTLRHAESLIGFPLFDRAGGRLTPTEDAHALFGEVRDIHDRVQALRQSGRNLKSGTGGVLRLSVLPSLALEAIPIATAEFLKAHPDTRFDLQTLHHEELLRKLYEREADLAIAHEAPANAPVGKRWLGEGELVLLYREADMPDAPSRVGLDVLAGRSFVSVAASGPLGVQFSTEIERLGVQLDEVVSARTFFVAAALVREGVGVTVIDSFTAKAALVPGLSMRPLKPSLAFDVHAMYLNERPPTALATAFLKALADVIDRA